MFSRELSGGWNATLRCQVSCSPGYRRSGLNTYQAISVCISTSFLFQLSISSFEFFL